MAARTDALAAHGLDEALRRAHRYVEAGAHMVFVEAPASEEDLATVGRELGASGAINVANMVEGSEKTPFKTPRELLDLGFQLALYPVGPFLAGHDAQRRYYDRLGRGTPTPAAAGSASIAATETDSGIVPAARSASVSHSAVTSAVVGGTGLDMGRS